MLRRTGLYGGIREYSGHNGESRTRTKKLKFKLKRYGGSIGSEQGRYVYDLSVSLPS